MTYAILMILAGLCNECNATTWELRYQGNKVATDIMDTREECIKLKKQLDSQTPAFTKLECVQVPTIRHQSAY